MLKLMVESQFAKIIGDTDKYGNPLKQRLYFQDNLSDVPFFVSQADNGFRLEYIGMVSFSEPVNSKKLTPMDVKSTARDLIDRLSFINEKS